MRETTSSLNHQNLLTGEKNRLLFQEIVQEFAGSSHDGKIKIRDASPSERLFYKIIQRMAHINSDFFNDISDYVKLEIVTSEGLIDRLNQMFSDIKKAYDENLQLQKEQYLKDIIFHYFDKKDTQKGSNRDSLVSQDLGYLIIFFQQQFNHFNEEVFLKNHPFEPEKFPRKKFLHDFSVIREKLSEKQKMIDQYLAFLQSDVHHLAQLLEVNPTIQGVEEKTLKDCFEENSEKDPDFQKLKIRAMQFAQLTAFMVALGEGSVAAVAMVAVIACPPAAIVVGALTFICGAIANYYLIRSDAYWTLLKFFKKKKVKDKNDRLINVRLMYLDAEGNLVPAKTRMIINICGISAISAGFVYGSLAAMSMYKGVLLPFFLKVGVVKLIACFLSGILAAIPVAFLAVGMAAIFYAVIDDFIKNKRWLGMISYFRDTYFPEYFFELTGSEKIAHICIHVPFHLLKLVLCLGIVAIIAVVSFGVFHSKGVELLALLTCPGKIASIFSTLATGLNGAMNVVFGISKIQDVFNLITLRLLVKGLLYLPLLVIPFLMFYGPARFWWKNNVVDPVSKSIVRGKTFCELTPMQDRQNSCDIVKTATLGVAILVNGIAQALLMKRNPFSLVAMSAFINSAFPNALAAQGEIKAVKHFSLQRKKEPVSHTTGDSFQTSFSLLCGS